MPTPDRSTKSGWEAIFEQLRPKLLSFASRKCRDPHKADDLVQDVLLSVWRCKPPDDVRHHSGFLYTVLRNRIAKVSRHERLRRECLEREAIVTDEQPDWTAGGTRPHSPFGMADLEQRQRAFAAILKSLPAQQRDALLMAGEGFKYADIAQQLAKSPDAVKKYLREALIQSLTLYKSLYEFDDGVPDDEE